MKRIILAAIIGVASLSSISTQAQVNVSVNIGSQPQWGPTGYDHVDYYYLPDMDVYYNVPAKQYVYLENGRWITRRSLPSRYKDYNLYNSYKVVMNNPKPYLAHQSHVQQYSKYKNYKGQQGNIRDSKDSRYASARSGRVPSNTNRVAASKNNNSNAGKGNNSNRNNRSQGNRQR